MSITTHKTYPSIVSFMLHFGKKLVIIGYKVNIFPEKGSLYKYRDITYVSYLSIYLQYYLFF